MWLPNVLGHLYLSVGVWLGVDLRLYTIKTCVSRGWCHVFKIYANHFEINSPHYLDCYEHNSHMGSWKMTIIVVKISNRICCSQEKPYFEIQVHIHDKYKNLTI
jgi:hypothetical protein